MALTHPYSVSQVAEVFLDSVYKLHGCLATIVSYRDWALLSNFWQSFFGLQGVQLAMSTTYHPQSDGQNEAVNRCLEGYFRHYMVLHTSISMTPFQVLYGFAPPLHIPYVSGDSKVAAVDEVLQSREEKI